MTPFTRLSTKNACEIDNPDVRVKEPILFCFAYLKDFSVLELTRDKYSTYPSRSKEHHAGGDLFGKQHEIVVGQILSSSLTKIIPIPHSSVFPK